MKSRLLATVAAVGLLFAGAAHAQGTGGTAGGSDTTASGTTSTGTGATGTTSGSTGTSAADMPGSTANDGGSPGMTGATRSGGMGSSMGTTTAGDRAGTTGSTATDTGGSMGTGSMGSTASDSMTTGSASGGSMGGATSAGLAGQMDAETIRELQQALKDQGQDIEVDGQWGPNTRQALMEFQTSEGLETTGQPDEDTLAALGVESELGMTGRTASPAGSTASDTSGMSGGSPSEAGVPSTGRMQEGTETSPTDSVTTPTPGSQTGNTPGSDADRLQPKPGSGQ